MTIPPFSDISLHATDRVAVIDEADADIASQYKWSLLEVGRDSPIFYAYCTAKACDWPRGMPRNNAGRLYLHRLLLLAQPRTEVDHRDGDGLNNRRSNLRLTTHRLNLANQTKQPGRSSRYKGVCFYKSRGNWTANVKVNQKVRFLGYFASEVDAAKAYDVAAIEAWGEYARPNFPSENPTETWPCYQDHQHDDPEDAVDCADVWEDLHPFGEQDVA